MIDEIRNNRLSRRQFLVNSTMLSAAVALAACAPAGTAPAAPAADAPAADAVAAEDPNAPQVGVYGTADAKVTIWHGLGGADGATFATMLEQYAKENPDVAIQSETYASMSSSRSIQPLSPQAHHPIGQSITLLKSTRWHPRA